jgi:hypothetical protein
MIHIAFKIIYLIMFHINVSFEFPHYTLTTEAISQTVLD